MFSFLMTAVLLLQTQLLAYPLIPIPDETPGAICTKKDPDFIEYRYKARIPYCRRHVSSGLKQRIYARYGIPKECQSRYTIDHFYPLSIGGSNVRENLWPEHRKVKATRQHLEEQVFEAVRDGWLSQSDALALIDYVKRHPPVEELTVSEDPCDQPEALVNP